MDSNVHCLSFQCLCQIEGWVSCSGKQVTRSSSYLHQLGTPSARMIDHSAHFVGKLSLLLTNPRSNVLLRRGCIPESTRVIFCVCKGYYPFGCCRTRQEHLRALWGDEVMSTCVVCVGVWVCAIRLIATIFLHNSLKRQLLREGLRMALIGPLRLVLLLLAPSSLSWAFSWPLPKCLCLRAWMWAYYS